MTTIGRPSESVPLCVDLDGTLVRADTTWEMLVAYLLDSPLGIIRVVRWARKGLGHVKVELWKNCPIDVEALPYDEHIRSWIEAEGTTISTVVLADIVGSATRAELAAFIADTYPFLRVIVPSPGRSEAHRAEQIAV